MGEHRFFDISYVGDVIVLAPQMRFSDLRDINEFQDELLDFLDNARPRQLIVDFRHVTRTSSWFIGTMIRLERRIKSLEGRVKLCGMNKTVREVFHITALDRRGFQIVERLEDAVAAFAAESSDKGSATDSGIGIGAGPPKSQSAH